MARPEKVAEVELLTQKMNESEGLVLADFSGLTVAEVNEMLSRPERDGFGARRRARAAGYKAGA